MRGAVAILVGVAVLSSAALCSASAMTLTVNAADDTDDGTCDGAHCSLREALNTSSEVERAGAAIDATATTSIVLGLWAIGAAITGLAAYLTRHPRN